MNFFPGNPVFYSKKPRARNWGGRRMDPMLVLSRKPGEAVVIGDNIEVTVLEVHGDRVKLGLCGPAEVPIRREEVQRRMARERAVCHASYV
jgi:carbon storage regulator